jgi:hypothetical protein
MTEGMDDDDPRVISAQVDALPRADMATELRAIAAHARDIEQDAANGCHGDVAVALPTLVRSLVDLVARLDKSRA